MALFRGQTFTGIVVSRKNYKERDMLVRILTSSFGFKTFFVRGVRKRGFKWGAGIIPFTKATYIGDISTTGLSFITNVSNAEQYQNIVEDITLNAYATYILELSRVAFGDDDQLAIKWYATIEQALFLIDQGLDPLIITSVIELQMLQLFGVQPELKHCVICQQNDRPMDFSEEYGGLLCKRHWQLDPNRLHLTPRTVLFMQRLAAVNLHKVSAIRVRPETKADLHHALDQIYYDMVGIYIPAKRFLSKLVRTHIRPLAPRTKNNTTD